MKKLTALIFLAIASVGCLSVSADQTFSDEATWLAALTSAGQDRLSSDYDNLIVDDLQVSVPIDQSWGNITESSSGFSPVLPITIGEGIIDGATVGLVFDASVCLQLNIDASNGPLEGFGFTVSGLSGINVRLFDGASEISSFAGIATPAVDGEFSEEFFGWLNCTNSNVTRIEICPADGTTFNGLVGGTFSFNPVADEPTCQDQLQGILNALDSIRSSASEDDQYWIDWAIQDLTCAQDEMLWETDDRLSDFGTIFFENIFWGTYSLECVSETSLVNDQLVAIQDLLSCVVENEIEFAMQNPEANDNLILYAEFFESYADAYADAGLFLHAVILHFYAWLFANCA